MVVLETIGVAFAMFSALPVPRIDWNERNMRYAMAAFPLIGAVIGALCIGWQQLAIWLGVGDPLRVVVLMLIPFFVTGGIHLDGMLDTAECLKLVAADGTPDRDIEGFPCGCICDPDLCGLFLFTLCGDGYGDCGYASGICDAVCRVAFLKRSVCRELPEDEKGGNQDVVFGKGKGIHSGASM